MPDKSPNVNSRITKEQPDFMREILSIGIPSGVESSLFNVGKVLLQSLVSTLGTASIAAYAVAGNLVTYLYLPGNALGAALMAGLGVGLYSSLEDIRKVWQKDLTFMPAMDEAVRRSNIEGWHRAVERSRGWAK